MLSAQPTVRRAEFVHRIQFSGPLVIGVSKGGGLKMIVLPRWYSGLHGVYPGFQWG